MLFSKQSSISHTNSQSQFQSCRLLPTASHTTCSESPYSTSTVPAQLGFLVPAASSAGSAESASKSSRDLDPFVNSVLGLEVAWLRMTFVRCARVGCPPVA